MIINPRLFWHSCSTAAHAELKKKKGRVEGGDLWEGKRNKESIQLTDGSTGRMCAAGEKNVINCCLVLWQWNVMKVNYSAINCFIVLYHYSMNCGLNFGYSNLNYTFSHNFITSHYKTTPPTITSMSETFQPKILEEMWQSSCWGTKPYDSYVTNFICPRFSTTVSSKNITPCEFSVGPPLFKKCPTFYRIQMFITMFTQACHLFLPSAR